MALSRITLALIQKSIFSYVAKGLSDSDIQSKILGKYSNVQPTDSGQVQTVINSTRRGAIAAGELEAGTRGAGETSGIPIDWSHIGTEPRWSYRVLVSSRNVQTGESFDTVITVYSKSTLDREDIVNLVEEQSTRDYFAYRYPSKVDYLAQTQITTYQIIGAGRRP